MMYLLQVTETLKRACPRIDSELLHRSPSLVQLTNHFLLNLIIQTWLYLNDFPLIHIICPSVDTRISWETKLKSLLKSVKMMSTALPVSSDSVIFFFHGNNRFVRHDLPISLCWLFFFLCLGI